MRSLGAPPRDELAARACAGDAAGIRREATRVHPCRRPPRGTSLVELMVSLVLFGIVGLVILRSLDHQARLHTSVLALLESRVQHAATHEILAVSLRALSPPAGDLRALSDSALIFRLPVGDGVTCATGPDWAMLAPDTLANGQVLTRILTAPQPRDTLWLLDEGPTDATVDDAWQPYAVSSVAGVAAGCAAGGVIAPPDQALTAWRVDVTSALSSTVSAGAPARLTRSARFSLYRSGSDSWLGYADWNAGGGSWNTIQPVSGPYLPFNSATPPASGIAFTPRDPTGLTNWGAPLSSVAAISLATRTRTRLPLRLPGMQRGRATDSLRSLVSLRNYK